MYIKLGGGGTSLNASAYGINVLVVFHGLGIWGHTVLGPSGGGQFAVPRPAPSRIRFKTLVARSALALA